MSSALHQNPSVAARAVPLGDSIVAVNKETQERIPSANQPLFENGKISATLNFLLARLGGRIFIPLQEVADVIGVARQTIRNRAAANKLPFATHTQGRNRYVHIWNLADYVDRVCAAPVGAAEPIWPEMQREPKKKANTEQAKTRKTKTKTKNKTSVRTAATIDLQAPRRPGRPSNREKAARRAAAEAAANNQAGGAA